VDGFATIGQRDSRDGLGSGQQSDRDLRLDACRGIALWFIFLDHVPNNVGSWLTLRHYGFSDTTELFMFVSGITRWLIERCRHATAGAP